MTEPTTGQLMTLEDAICDVLDAGFSTEELDTFITTVVDAWVTDNVDTTPIDYGPRRA